MKLYLVGGAVRDRLMGREPHDLDFVVTGGTEAEFSEAFPVTKKVGLAFPVFEVSGLGQVAMARRERKTGLGHSNFQVEFGPEVTLEEDLSRRDLTINAMAMSVDDDVIIDPFGGQKDIEEQMLRHVSDAFSDDPLRLYRVARFSAQLGFRVHASTVDKCKKMSYPDLETLSVERVREEFMKALRAPYPTRFFEVLINQVCHGSTHFSEILSLSFVPAGPFHDEGDALAHTMLALEAAVELGANELERFAVLCHDLGKTLTPESEYPHHYDHDELAGGPINAFCDRLGLSVDFRRAALFAGKEHMRACRFSEMRPGKKVDLVVAADRNPLKVEGLAKVVEADTLGRISSKENHKKPWEHLLRAAEIVRAIKVKNLMLPEDFLEGPVVGELLRQAKIRALKNYL